MRLEIKVSRTNMFPRLKIKGIEGTVRIKRAASGRGGGGLRGRSSKKCDQMPNWQRTRGLRLMTHQHLGFCAATSRYDSDVSESIFNSTGIGVCSVD